MDLAQRRGKRIQRPFFNFTINNFAVKNTNYTTTGNYDFSNAQFYYTDDNQHLPLVRKAVEEGEISKTYLAMIQDRNLMDQGLEQIYGTQIKGQANKEGEWVFFLWPVKDPEKVNFLRKNMGIKSTVKEYLERMDMEVRFYTLDEIDDL